MRADDHDVALVRAWRLGDADAARRVVALHAPAMTRVALSLCSRAEDADDVVQDALLRVHRSLAAFDAGRGSLRAWLVGVTVNRARQMRRGSARYGGLLARFRREPFVIAETPTTSGDLDFARRQLAALTPREREAFVLVEIEELTSAEAGAVMGIADSTVRVLVRRARSRLRATDETAPHPVVRAGGETR